MTDRLTGKTAVITGAGSGLGRAAAELFAAEGANVLVADRWQERAERIAAGIGAQAAPFVGDVSQGEDVQAMFSAAAERWGRIDIVYNNAGIAAVEGTVRDCPESLFDDLIAVNLRGVWLGMKYAIPHLEAAGGGSIISTASIAGITGLAGASAYCASKGGVIALTRAAAGEWASKGIRINCVCPGSIATRLRDDSEGEQDPADVDRRRASGAAVTPLGRGGESLDIAQTVLWLASDESSFVTGQAIVVDGGWTAIDRRWEDFTGRAPA